MEQTTITMLTPDQVLARLAEDANLLILDVRNEDEWNVRHISNAMLVPMHALRTRLGELDPARETVVVCEHGSRSLSVAQFLATQAGFQKVANMVGGMAEWTGPVA